MKITGEGYVLVADEAPSGFCVEILSSERQCYAAPRP